MRRFFPLTKARATLLNCWSPIEIATLRASSRHCGLERAVYEVPLLDDTIGQHPLAIPMKLRMTIESARLVRPFFHAHLQALAVLPLGKGTVDPFAQTALSRLRSNSRPLVQIPVPRASAQIANEFAAAVSLCRRDDPP